MVYYLTVTLISRVLVFLLWNPLVFSSVKQRGCLVIRARGGDRIHFYDYNGTCKESVNPCQTINGSTWKASRHDCLCQCSASRSYRGDEGHCVENRVIREGCTLLFNRENRGGPLRVFNNSSSLKFKARSLPVEDCNVTKTYYRNVAWKELQPLKAANTFTIRHEDITAKKHAHFLEWDNGQPVAELLGKIVKVHIECANKNQGRGGKDGGSLCIVFKVNGSTNLSCPIVESPSFPTRQTDVLNISSTSSSITEIQETVLTEKPFTEGVNASVGREEDDGTFGSDDDNSDSGLSVGKRVSLPVWLIGVITGGAVIATLALTAIVWMCCKMNRRRRKRRKKRSLMARNPVDNNDETAFVPFHVPDCAPRECEAGYAKVGNPVRKGYAVLKPVPGSTRSDYQRLLKPKEDHSGYLLPMEERDPPERRPTEDMSTIEPAVYSEAKVSPPPENRSTDKEYDYAKPENFTAIRSSRASLDNLDFCVSADQRSVECKEDQKEDQENGPSSPVYVTVEGPNSPPLEAPSGESLEEVPMKNGPESTIPYYVELM
ncbi:uncharacterized protein [Montipora capricornis]|uniref:uncharacterized protein n=1 Tax=Montipora capricornis TaxID=246305 RepID=UPI0035F1BC58